MKKTRAFFFFDFDSFHGWYRIGKGLMPVLLDQTSDGYLADLLRRLFRDAF